MSIAVVVVVIVVIAAVIVAGLYLAGVGPFSFAKSKGGNGNGGSGSEETFSQAAGKAQSAAAAQSNGPWTLIGGVGVVISASVAVNTTLLNASTSAGGCSTTLLAGASTVTSIPSSSASASSGESNAWTIWYANAANNVLEVTVFNGVATAIITQTSYGGCLTGVTGVSLSASAIDSPAAAEVAASAGGNSFGSSHTAFDVEEILVPSVTITFDSMTNSIGASWDISYTTCDLGSHDGSTLNGEPVAQFTASINATTGKLIQSENTSTACPTLSGSGSGGKATLESKCSAFFIESYAAPTYWNNGSLICTINTLTAGDLTVSIENATTGNPVSTSGFTLELTDGIGGSVDSTYDFGTNTWSTTSSPIGTVEDYWVLVTSSTLAGDNIVITATGAAPVTGSVSGSLGGST
jgi:hypothetical protein